MTFETPPLKLPQIIPVPPSTVVRSPLVPEVVPPVPNFLDTSVSSTSYTLPICPACWGTARRWSHQQCVLLQS